MVECRKYLSATNNIRKGKNKMNKKRPIILLLSLVTVLTALLAVLPLAASSVSETDDGIFYSIENGEVTVEGFNYAGSTMDIPSKIEGLPVKYIADQACRGNSAITELIIPDSVVSVGEYSFAECKNLKKVVFDDGCREISPSAFERCDSLLSVELPETLEAIGASAFESCIMLRKMTIPASVNKIEEYAFLGCSELRLDVSENPLASEYAKEYSIPTSFTASWTFTVVLTLAIVLVSGGAYFFIGKKVIRKLNKNG